jgi:PPM family protein phosphatase
MKISGKTDIGRVRRINQDAFLECSNHGVHLVAVCDGMGGAAAGEVASSKAVAYLRSVFEDNPPSELTLSGLSDWLKQAIESVNERLYALAQAHDQYLGMGTTLVAALIYGRKIAMANVGDSRIYLLRESLQQITTDHSLVQELIDQGRLTEAEAKVHPQRSILTNVLAIQPHVVVDRFVVDEPIDALLLASDGLHGYVDDVEIETCLRSEDPLESITQSLIDLANAKGGFDNTTVIMIDFRGNR